MPWLAANGIELRWVPEADFATMGLFASGATRLKHTFRSDVVLLLDADTLIRRPLDDLIECVYHDRVVAGAIAHTTPLTSGKLDQPDWGLLFSLCGLPEPSLEYEHTGWGYMLADTRYRYCPPYFNYGVIAVPAESLSQIGHASEVFLARLREVFESFFDAQIALTMAITQLKVRVRALPLRYNMPNCPLLEALHARELEYAIVLHLLREHQFRREETFSSLANLESFLSRDDLRVVNQIAQGVIGAILPDLAAEERIPVAAA
jgi:hypothetical protein